jgi:hypothetical protein
MRIRSKAHHGNAYTEQRLSEICTLVHQVCERARCNRSGSKHRQLETEQCLGTFQMPRTGGVVFDAIVSNESYLSGSSCVEARKEHAQLTLLLMAGAITKRSTEPWRSAKRHLQVLLQHRSESNVELRSGEASCTLLVSGRQRSLQANVCVPNVHT